MTIRQFERPDLAWAQELNRREVPFVNFLNLADFEALIMRSAYARLFLTSDENPIGLLVGFLPGAAYKSANYRWISDRFDDFFYIDRIIVDAAERGQGVARRLYDDAAIFAAENGFSALMCEVNSKPANDVSLTAHAQMEFEAVGRQSTDNDGEKEVTYLRKVLMG